jgi:hypothetical protein
LFHSCTYSLTISSGWQIIFHLHFTISLLSCCPFPVLATGPFHCCYCCHVYFLASMCFWHTLLTIHDTHINILVTC